METLGLITLKEADSLLEYNLTYDYWNDTTVYTYATGTYKTSGASVNLIGTGTLATTELIVGKNIEIDYNFAKVATITDNTHISLDTSIDVTTDEIMKILTPTERTTLEAYYLLKKKALLTAYNYIITYCNLPSAITVELERAQAFLAAILYYTNGQATSGSGTDKNVKSYSIGDMSYTFSSSDSFSGNAPYEIFPNPIYEMLSPYFKSNKVFGVVTTSAR